MFKPAILDTFPCPSHTVSLPSVGDN